MLRRVFRSLGFLAGVLALLVPVAVAVAVLVPPGTLVVAVVVVPGTVVVPPATVTSAELVTVAVTVVMWSGCTVFVRLTTTCRVCRQSPR